MIIRIDQKAEEPLYLQIRSQIIAAIARGELVPAPRCHPCGRSPATWESTCTR